MTGHLVINFLLTLSMIVRNMAPGMGVENHPLPTGYPVSTVFSVHVAGTDVPVNAFEPKYDYAHFSMHQAEAKVQISIRKGEIRTWRISPAREQIKATVQGNTITFRLRKNSYIIVKLNALKELIIAADGWESRAPKPTGRNIFNVQTRYHADATGGKHATEAIQRAIDDASAFGGGTVYIPPGVYLAGNLTLKSNIEVYLEGGAVVKFTGKKEDYRIHARKKSQNRDLTWWISTDSGARNIRIYGRGTLDGNGKVATEKGRIGNHILAIMHCDNFILDGIVVRESGAWAIIPTRSRNVQIKNLKLFNRFDMGENDGIDVMECSGVRVEHCIGIALDDPFSTKTWRQNTDLCRNWPGVPLPQYDISFSDCLSWTYCYGFKVGQGVMQPQEKIAFRNCVVYDAAVGIGVHHKWGNQSVRDVVFDSIDIEKLSYQNDDHRTWGVFFMQNGDKEGSGPISGLRISRITICDAGKSPVKLKGISSERLVSDVTFKDVRMPNSAKAAKTLAQMNVTDTAFTRNVKVLTK